MKFSSYFNQLITFFAILPIGAKAHQVSNFYVDMNKLPRRQTTVWLYPGNSIDIRDTKGQYLSLCYEDLLVHFIAANDKDLIENSSPIGISIYEEQNHIDFGFFDHISHSLHFDEVAAVPPNVRL